MEYKRKKRLSHILMTPVTIQLEKQDQPTPNAGGVGGANEQFE
jgi:hypothetical protein